MDKILRLGFFPNKGDLNRDFSVYKISTVKFFTNPIVYYLTKKLESRGGVVSGGVWPLWEKKVHGFC